MNNTHITKIAEELGIKSDQVSATAEVPSCLDGVQRPQGGRYQEANVGR